MKLTFILFGLLLFYGGLIWLGFLTDWKIALAVLLICCGLNADNVIRTWKL